MAKDLLLILLVIVLANSSYAQENTITPSNRTVANLEKNILFYANKKYLVTQTGASGIPPEVLFNGRYEAAYSDNGVTDAAPYVLLIENLPHVHTQSSAWVGWSTRYWQPYKFKIEVFNIWDYGAGGPPVNQWITVADESNYANGSYMVNVHGKMISKIRFTVYEGQGPNRRFGLSEFFFLQPETASAYEDLLVKYDENGNVGIGTTNTKGYKLAVAGNLIAESVKVQLQSSWADYVFEDTYKPLSLRELEQFVKTNKHLPEIPSAKEVEKNGINLGEMNVKLLKK